MFRRGFKVNSGPCSRSSQQRGFNRIAVRECWGRQESLPVHQHTLSHENSHSCTLIKSARQGPGQTKVIVQGGTDRNLSAWTDLSLQPSKVCVFVAPSPSPSVINEQPFACLYVFEQTAPVSSSVKTTSPAGALNSADIFSRLILSHGNRSELHLLDILFQEDLWFFSCYCPCRSGPPQSITLYLRGEMSYPNDSLFCVSSCHDIL